MDAKKRGATDLGRPYVVVPPTIQDWVAQSKFSG